MKLKLGWVWDIYFLIYFLIISFSTIYYFLPQSTFYLYFQILIAFDIYFLISYCLSALSIIFDYLSLVPLFLFVCNIQFLNKYFWRWMFILRLAFNLTARSYEFHFIKSLLYQDKYYAFLLVALIVIISIPSYMAHYLYAFRDKTVFDSKRNLIIQSADR